MTENTVTIAVTNLEQQADGYCPTIQEDDLDLLARLLVRAAEQGNLQQVLYEAATRMRNQFQDERKLAQLPGRYRDEQDDLLQQLVLAARQAALFSNGTVCYGITDKVTYTPSPMSEAQYKEMYPLLPCY